ncbi:VOC family protein [Actinoalloteichus hymeniacidonis]|uniref:Glyoxalase-like domain-containing protein n=1 Tax=Actinoalloteichus hymeniacidonis TaxID=340345 RepID=A0AAC9HPZ8_9PSEU|nr:VOC family protein [Actinoalloteichus hymeniacidonis]AOS62871.1 hypothetical protein TL08_10285 [Actinoalloteichus hymeniacidonis]MBB5909096.1 hypothetical protein [Actinoalloteichus hymeniacidonis]
MTFDATDPARLAAFWARALRYELEPPPAGFATWADFARAANLPPQQVKNRVHLDVNVGRGATDKDEQKARARAHVETLVQAGAVELREVDEDGPAGWFLVLRDPPGQRVLRAVTRGRGPGRSKPFPCLSS